MERNRVIDCDMGISFGNSFDPAPSHTGGIIRNNFVKGYENSDFGICISKAPGAKVINNTVYSPGNWPYSIEVQYASSSNCLLMNNLTDEDFYTDRFEPNNPDQVTNFTGAQTGYFIDAAGGDLHLISGSLPPVNAGTSTPDHLSDFDCRAINDGSPDIGADEYDSIIPAPTPIATATAHLPLPSPTPAAHVPTPPPTPERTPTPPAAATPIPVSSVTPSQADTPTPTCPPAVMTPTEPPSSPPSATPTPHHALSPTPHPAIPTPTTSLLTGEIVFQEGVSPDASYAGTADVIVAADGNENANLGAYETLEIFYGDGDELRRTLLYWDISALPGGITVSTARVELYRYGGDAAGDMPLALYRVTGNWAEGFGDDFWPGDWYLPDGATWYTSDGSTPWQSPGGDYDTVTDYGRGPNGIVARATLPASLEPGWLSMDVTAVAKDWVENGVPNHGLLLRALEGQWTYHYFHSRDCGIASRRPRLVIEYGDGPLPTPPPGPIATPTAAVLISTPTPPPCCQPVLQSGDYDGDGISDIAIYRPSTGLWAVRGRSRVYFGGDGDTPVPGDYNGDGTTDPAVYCAATGLWAVLGGIRTYFGAPGDLPVPGDYDGDGTIDPAIFRARSGLWAIMGVSRKYLGISGDLPVPGDYDGDGTDEAGVFREDTGLWALEQGERYYFGRAGDLPVPGDYYGEGNRTPALFRPSTKMWAIRGGERVYFGGSADIPVPGDYDGDDIDDPGIFRESNGLWAVKGILREYFGRDGDQPVTR